MKTIIILDIILTINFFNYSTQLIQHSRHTSTWLHRKANIRNYLYLRSWRQKSDDSLNGDFNSVLSHRKSIPLLLLQNEAVILPGEEKTIWTDKLALIEDSIVDYNSWTAVGMILSEEPNGQKRDYDGEGNLMEMASLCRIKKYKSCDGMIKKRNGYFVTLECVGRVQLSGLDQYNPYFKFYFTLVQEAEENLKECSLVLQNIEIFLNKFAHYEVKTFDREDKTASSCCADGDDHENHTMVSKYNVLLKKNFRMLGSLCSSQSDLMNWLTVSSWAAYTCTEGSSILNMKIMENYRIRALDYDNVFDRLKLAQYMLREQDLYIMGSKLHSGMDDERPGTNFDGIRTDLNGFE